MPLFVSVIMANDFPHKVIQDVNEAISYCNRMMDAQGLRQDGYGWVPLDPKRESSPVIYYKQYRFVVEDK